jgi:hypothetical protein
LIVSDRDWPLWHYKSIGANYILVVLLATVLFCRVIFPQSLYDMMSWLNSPLRRLIPNVVETFNYHWAYVLPICGATMLWILFVYQLDIAFYRQIVRGNLWLTLLSASGLWLGGAAAIAVMFAPSLCLVPFCISGLMLALVTYATTWVYPLSPMAKNEMRHWGRQVLANSIVIPLVTPYLYFILADFKVPWNGRGLPFGLVLPADWFALITIWFVAIAMAIAWYAIRAKHGTEHGWSARIARFDHGRVR